MKKLVDTLAWCDKCQENTIHIRNEKRINWLMHIFLIFVTGGVWLIPFIFMVILNDKSKEKWHCTLCKQTNNT